MAKRYTRANLRDAVANVNWVLDQIGIDKEYTVEGGERTGIGYRRAGTPEHTIEDYVHSSFGTPRHALNAMNNDAIAEIKGYQWNS